VPDLASTVETSELALTLQHLEAEPTRRENYLQQDESPRAHQAVAARLMREGRRRVGKAVQQQAEGLSWVNVLSFQPGCPFMHRITRSASNVAVFSSWGALAPPLHALGAVATLFSSCDLQGVSTGYELIATQALPTLLMISSRVL